MELGGETEKLIIRVWKNFNLETTVCNHGFFMMPPNRWIPSQKCLTRPLRLCNDTSLTVWIKQPPNNKSFIIIKYYRRHSLSSQDRQVIRDQVTRMLRISTKDEAMLQKFFSVHPQAQKAGFGRIFRSPTLFEDIVKSLLLCYSTWCRSLDMAQALCSNLPRKSDDNVGNFPSAKEIASLDEETLNKHCKLGYRASIIGQVAKDIDKGRLNLQEDYSYKSLRRRLSNIKGFGPFTIANILMCLGYYQDIPVDTETIKHLKEVHGNTQINNKNKERIIQQVYKKYAPYQCLAYWMERLDYYEKRLGKLSELPHSHYCNVSTTKLHLIANLQY